MSPKVKVTYTYNKISPESAEEVDFSDHGFAYWNGSNLEEDFSVMNDEEGEITSEVIELPEDNQGIEEFVSDRLGGVWEWNMSPINPLSELEKGESISATEVDPDLDYSTGEETRYEIHLDPLEI